MEQKPSQNTPPIRIAPVRRQTQYSMGFRGLIFFFLAILVLCFGFIGYLEYDRLVKPYMREYLCCLPAIILAAILLFLGVASRVTTIRSLNIGRPPKRAKNDLDRYIMSDHDLKPDGDRTDKTDKNDRTGSRSDAGQSGTGLDPKYIDVVGEKRDNRMYKYESESTSRTELVAQKRNLVQFLNNLDEQYQEGLLMGNVYHNLKNKYKLELNRLNIKLRSTKDIKSKKIKGKKN